MSGSKYRAQLDRRRHATLYPMLDRAYRNVTSLHREWGGLWRLDAILDQLRRTATSKTDQIFYVLGDETGDVAIPIASEGFRVVIPENPNASTIQAAAKRLGYSIEIASALGSSIFDGIICAARGVEISKSIREALRPQGFVLQWVERSSKCRTWQSWVEIFLSQGFRPRACIPLGAAAIGLRRWQAASLANRARQERIVAHCAPTTRWLFVLDLSDAKRPLVEHLLPTMDAGGAQRAAIDLSAALLSRGVDVEIVSILGGGPLEEVCLSSGIRYFNFGLRTQGAWGRFRTLVRWFQVRRPDIVHTHLLAADVWGLLAAWWVGIRIRVRTEHSVKAYYSTTREWMKRLATQFAAVHVAVSEDAKRFLMETEGISESKIQVIRPGIRLEQFPLTPRQSVANPLRLLIIGSLSEGKGHVFLWEVLLKLSIPWKLDVVGDGELRSAMELKVDALGLASRVRFRGFQADISHWLQSADLVCMPSQWEGLGLVAIEAAVSGTPFLATKLPSLSEVFSEDASLLPLGDVGAWKEAIESFAQHSEREIARAHQRALSIRDRMSVERMAVSHIALYRRLGMNGL